MLKPKWRSERIKRQVEMGVLELGKKAYCSPMPLTRDRRPINRDRWLGEDGLLRGRADLRLPKKWTSRKTPNLHSSKDRTEPFQDISQGKVMGPGK